MQKLEESQSERLETGPVGDGENDRWAEHVGWGQGLTGGLVEQFLTSSLPR